MTDQNKKLMEILAIRRQSNGMSAIENASSNKNYLKQLEKRRSIMIKKMILLRKQYFMLLAAAVDLSKQSRLCWTKERSQTFWEIDCQVNDDDIFKSNFRMKRSTFLELCSNLRVLERSDTSFRKAILLHKWVAIALHALGSSSEYRTIGNMFGVGKSTVCGIVLEFCTQFWNVLSPTCMPSFPLTRQKVAELVRGFEFITVYFCPPHIDEETLVAFSP